MAGNWIEQVKVQALESSPEATVAIASIPLPREDRTIGVFQGLNSQAVPLAWYPGGQGPDRPRQALVLGIGEGALSDELALAAATARQKVKVTPGGYAPAERGGSGGAPGSVNAPWHGVGQDSAPRGWAGPRWRLAVIDKKKTGFVMNETDELVLSGGGREIGIRMGIQLSAADSKPAALRCWEFVQVEELWAGPACRAIRAAGYIGATEVNEDNWCDPKRYNFGPWLHKHNWLHAEVYALLFANGLVQITARHVNNRFFDQGEHLAGFVPVIAFRTAGAQVADTPLDGSRTDFPLGRVHLDLARSTDLFGPEHPARLSTQGDLVVLQPYEGVELDLGDGEPKEEWRLEASERKMWKGMARSFGLDLSLADRPIRTRRYLAPEGWVAHCGMLWADGVLPAGGNYDAVLDRVAEACGYGKITHRFLQSSGLSDGEFAYVNLRQAYRTRRGEFLRAALHHAYAMADIGVDHADYTIRIGGMKRNSIAMPLQRVNGMLAGYLESGDPYLLRMAQTVADTAYAMDRSNWPRRSYGRDGAYIRSLTRLYEVTGEAMYLRRAGDACRRAAQCQYANGAFGDQGSTYGSHGHLCEIIKPWMNSILSHAMVDYLERAGRDPMVEEAVQRCADWILSTLAQDADGTYWPYEIGWGENEEAPFQKYRPEAPRQKHPYGEMHLDYNARIMLWASRRTGDPKYVQGWRAAFERHFIKKQAKHSVYAGTRTLEDIPWHEAHLWGAHWNGQDVTFDPLLHLIEDGREATIALPNGKSLRVRRTAAGVEAV